MTTDRRQANADVARAMGWTQRDNHGEPCYYGEPPNLYSVTAEGAEAREEAEEWLEERELGRIQTWKGSDGWYSRWSIEGLKLFGPFATRHEARASAIVAAFRAVQGAAQQDEAEERAERTKL